MSQIRMVNVRAWEVELPLRILGEQRAHRRPLRRDIHHVIGKFDHSVWASLLQNNQAATLSLSGHMPNRGW